MGDCVARFRAFDPDGAGDVVYASEVQGPHSFDGGALGDLPAGGDLGDRLLDIAARQAKAWLERGTPLVVSVNISLLQLRDRTFVERLAGILEAHGLPGHWIELEVTESTAMQDVQATIEALTSIRARGVRLSMDDFGTAYSSLAYLKLLPLDTLKIDQSFVADIAEDPTDTPNEASIAQAIIALGQSLNLRVVAEGVETAAQRRFLQLLGCDEAQGYLFVRPMPAAELEALHLR